MKKNIIKIVSMMLIIATISPITVQASTIQQSELNLTSMQSTEFENLIVKFKYQRGTSGV